MRMFPTPVAINHYDHDTFTILQALWKRKESAKYIDISRLVCKLLVCEVQNTRIARFFKRNF